MNTETKDSLSIFRLQGSIKYYVLGRGGGGGGLTSGSVMYIL